MTLLIILACGWLTCFGVVVALYLATSPAEPRNVGMVPRTKEDK